MLYKTIIYTTVIMSGFFVKCASKTNYALEENQYTNLINELDNLEAKLKQAEDSQVDVLSPKAFARAKNYFTLAREKISQNTFDNTFYKAVSDSKFYLGKAKNNARTISRQIAQTMHKRQLAMEAGAKKNFHQWNKTELHLKNFIASMENGDEISDQEDGFLQGQYSQLELTAIKEEKLGNIRKILDLAKQEGAELYTPKTFQDAREKYELAEKIITLDCHNMPAINIAVRDALIAAQYNLNIFATAVASKNYTPENLIPDLISRDKVAYEKKIAKRSRFLSQDKISQKQSATQHISNMPNSRKQGNNHE